MNLEMIAEKAYGHSSFSGFVAHLNQVRSPENLQAGTQLNTPSLVQGLLEAGLDPRYQQAVSVLALSWYQMQSAVREFETERDAAQASDGQSFPLGQAVGERLSTIADRMDLAIGVLHESGWPGHVRPKSSLGQFAGSATSLRTMGQGKVGSLDYDVFMAKKGFGLGFAYLLSWVQSGHQ